MEDSFQFKVIQSRKDLYYSKIFTDVTLVSDDFGKFLAHKTVLASASYWFKSLLHLSEDEKPVIHLKGIPKEELEAVLKYVYLGEVSVASKKLENLKIAARELGIHDFMDAYQEEPQKLQFLSNSTYETSEFKTKTKTLNFLHNENFVEDVANFGSNVNITLDFLQDENNFHDEEVNHSTETLNFLKDENNFEKEAQAPDQELTSYQQQNQTAVLDVNQFLSEPFNLSSLFFDGSRHDDEETACKEETERESSEGQEVDENIDEGSTPSSLIQGSWGKSDDNRCKKRPKEDPSECEICGLITTTKRSMQRHHKVVHELRFKVSTCNVCGKEVRGDQRNVNAHMAVHFPNLAKKYDCSQCDYTSKSSVGLKKHIRHIHIGIL